MTVKTTFVSSTGPVGGAFYAERTPDGGLYLKSRQTAITLTAQQASLLTTLLGPAPRRRWWRR